MLDMRWLIANEAHRAKWVVINLISNKHKWNNCLIKNFIIEFCALVQCILENYSLILLGSVLILQINWKMM